MTESPERKDLEEGLATIEEVKRMAGEGTPGPEIAKYLFDCGVKNVTLAAAVLRHAGFIANPTEDSQGISVSLRRDVVDPHPESNIVRLDPQE